MGTSDPTKEKILKPNEVAIIKNGDRICGQVLVYKNPDKHCGDVFVFDAVWDERLNPYVGPAKHTIFFSVRSDRPVADEVADSDLSGDLFWVWCNTETSSWTSKIFRCLRRGKNIKFARSCPSVFYQTSKKNRSTGF